MTARPSPETQRFDGSGSWRLDPERSSVEFQVRHFFGLMTVKGRFRRYRGTMRLGTEPAIELTIEAASLDTKHGKRDTHLRSADFFDVAAHPNVSFSSQDAALDDKTLRVRGELRAAGHEVPLQLEAKLVPVGEELVLEAETSIDQRRLGMMWSPLGMVRPPSRLLVSGRLVRA